MVKVTEIIQGKQYGNKLKWTPLSVNTVGRAQKTLLNTWRNKCENKLNGVEGLLYSWVKVQKFLTSLTLWYLHFNSISTMKCTKTFFFCEPLKERCTGDLFSTRSGFLNKKQCIIEKLCKCSHWWSSCSDWNKKGFPHPGYREHCSRNFLTPSLRGELLQQSGWSQECTKCYRMASML